MVDLCNCLPRDKRQRGAAKTSAPFPAGVRFFFVAGRHALPSADFYLQIMPPSL